MLRKLFFGCFVASLLVACAPLPSSQHKGVSSGSYISKNVFVDSSQFGNRKLKLRFRNSSGSSELSPGSLRGVVANQLTTAGYQITQDDFGILLDVNLFYVDSVSEARRSSNEAGAILGAVLGYEATKRRGGFSGASGAVIGAVSGAAIQEIIRSASEREVLIAVAEVNIGVKRVSSKSRDVFVIGGNRYSNQDQDGDETFSAFAERESLKIAVYAGGPSSSRSEVISEMERRLGAVVAGLI